MQSINNPSAGFSNPGAKVAIQAGTYHAHGNTVVQHSQDVLGQLPNAINAPFNSYAKQYESICLDGTRVRLLKEIEDWAMGDDKRCILWLRGMAGTGKTTIARTIARRFHDRSKLAASFFFSRGGGDVSNAEKFVTSIAVQLAHNLPPIREHIYSAVNENSNVTSQSLYDQWQKLILTPLSKMHEAGTHVMVVDALDECDDDRDVKTIFQLLARFNSLDTIQFRVFLTGRPETPIRQVFASIAKAEQRQLELHGESPPVVYDDIHLFLKTELEDIGRKWHCPLDWPDEQSIAKMVQRASGLFIWAATACRFIDEGSDYAVSRLEKILRSEVVNSATPEGHLDQIYVTVLQSSISSKLLDDERDEQYSKLNFILGSLAVLLSTLSLISLSKLLKYDELRTEQLLRGLHAIIVISEDPNQPLRLHHPSFRDFLLNRNRCTDVHFWVNSESAHKTLASCCLDLMTAPHGLRQDICNLSEPGMKKHEISKSRITDCLPAELQYACRYWVDHLERSQQGIEDGDQPHQFLERYLLYWLEAMSLMDEAYLCARLVAKLQSLVTLPGSTVAKFLHDASRFVSRFVYILAEAPLQIYSSCLLFSPQASVVRQTFLKEVPQMAEVILGRESQWGACHSVLEGHLDRINAVAVSPDGQMIASGSCDTTVRLWETTTGHCTVLEGHAKVINAVAFSPDGQTVASASDDSTVRLWKINTGHCTVLEGHLDVVRAMAFSPDGRTVASVSSDKTVRLWETATSTCNILEGHSERVRAVSFSPDGNVVASASRDLTVRLWVTATGQCKVLEGPRNEVTTLAFSTDGKLLASGSEDGTVRLWEAVTGRCCSILEGHSSVVSKVVFSPDGQKIASASYDNTVRLCDRVTGQCSALEGHKSFVNDVAFSSDGHLIVSGSDDYTVRLWETATGRCCGVLKGHSNGISAVEFSLDGHLIASASYDRTVRLWETEMESRNVLEEGSDEVSPVALSPDTQLIAISSDKNKVLLQHKATEQIYSVLEDHLGPLIAVAVSLDGKLIVTGSVDGTARLWEIATGSCSGVLKGHSDEVQAVAFSLDGQLVVSGSEDHTVRLWETATGRCCSVLEGHSDGISAVAFSLDGHLVASASWDGTVWLWNITTGRCCGVLGDNDLIGIQDIVFSTDGQGIKTDIGYIALPGGLTIDPPAQAAELSSSISVQGNWISRHSRHLIWIPPEYRSGKVVVRKHIVILRAPVVDPEHIVILRFPEDGADTAAETQAH